MEHEEQVQLAALPVVEGELDPGLVALLDQVPQLEAFGGSGDAVPVGDEPPFDLRVNRPRALDLVRLWRIWKQPVPPEIEASLGPRTPILLNHVVTPFPADGKLPGGVMALGYEIFLHDGSANTVSVAPSDELLRLGSVGQEVELGLDLSGAVSVPAAALPATASAPSFSLGGASLRATTSTTVQFALRLPLTLRKLVGAPVGSGGAVWKIYRQDEPLDRPHTLLQTLLVDAPAGALRCTVKAWVARAGLLGTRIGQKTWRYADQEFTISLAGLGA